MNAALTSSAILQLPSPSYYDGWWQSHGFCVNQDPNRRIHTEVLCFVYLTTSVVLVKILLEYAKLPAIQGNVQLESKMKGSVFANAAHGGGHLFLMLLGGPPPALELKLTAAAIGNIIMLLCFWYGVLKNIVVSISNFKGVLWSLSVVILTIQYLLDVPGELSFTYSQSVILFAGAIDQLVFIQRSEKRFTYLANAVTYVPLWFLYDAEMTKCTSLLAAWGGHSLYDFYLAMVPFLHYGAVHIYDSSQNRKLKTV